MDVCHHVRLMHMSTSSHFPQVDTEKRRVERDDDDDDEGTFQRDLGPVYAGAPHNCANMFKSV